MPESNWERAARYAQENAKFRAYFDAMAYGTAWGKTSASGFEHQPYADIYTRPLLHGATDYRRRADGVWEMPQ